MAVSNVDGIYITKPGRCPDPTHVEAIVELAVPSCQKDVLHVLGMVTFNRNYIPNLSSVAACLHDVAKDGVDVARAWKDDVHGEAFREIKRLLVSAPFLQLPDVTRPFRIHVDSSLNGRGMGAVLLQQDLTWVPPEGKTMGHAGAIVSGSSGTAAAKQDALEAVGVRVGQTPSEAARIMRSLLRS